MTSQHPLLLAQRLLKIIDDDLHRLSTHDLTELSLTSSHIVSAVRCRINALIPVNTLPDELLAIVFKYALQWRSGGRHSRGYQTASHGNDMISRIPLTHVCRRWRSVALTTATLWTIIDEDLNHLQDVFLDRSGGAPIQVLSRYSADQQAGVHILPHAKRVEDLYLIYPPASEESGLDTMLPFDAPNLECLTLSSSGTTGRGCIDLDVLDHIFPNGLPSLRRLVLWHMRRLPDVPYERLTHLLIGQGKRLPIIGLLRRCTMLRNLALIDASVSGLPPSENEDSEVQVQLPHLRVLTLGIFMNLTAAALLPRLLPILLLPNEPTLRLVGSQTTTLLALNDFDLHGMSIMSTLSIATIDLRENGHCALRASGLSSSVLLDLQDFRAQRKYGVTRGKKCFIPLDAVEELTYRTEVRNADLDMLLFCKLPCLRLLRFVDAYIPSRDFREEVYRDTYRLNYKTDREPRDYIEALSWVIEESPQLSEIEIWSANMELFTMLRLPKETAMIRKIAFYYTGGDDKVMDSLDLSHLRLRVPEVVICMVSSTSEPSTTMPEKEALQWEEGEW